MPSRPFENNNTTNTTEKQQAVPNYLMLYLIKKDTAPKLQCF